MNIMAKWSCILLIFTSIGFRCVANADSCNTYEVPPHLLEMIYHDEHNSNITNRALCLGTAVSSTEVLTNVNCLPKTAKYLYVRQVHLNNSDPEPPLYKAANFTSNYNIHFLFTMYNNVAKVTLTEALPEFIVPGIKTSTVNGEVATSIFVGRYKRTKIPFTLCVESIPVRMISYSECNVILGTLYDSPIPKGVLDTQLCFRYNKPPQKDYLPMLGGPLQVDLGDGRFGIIGTISYYQVLQEFGVGIVTPVTTDVTTV